MHNSGRRLRTGRNARRSTTNSSHAVIAIASAVRSLPSSSAISPKYLPFAHDLEDGLSALAGRHADADASLQDGHHALAGCPSSEDSASGGVSSLMRRCEDGIGSLVAESGEQEGASEEIAPLGECGSDQICPQSAEIGPPGSSAMVGLLRTRRNLF